MIQFYPRALRRKKQETKNVYSSSDSYTTLFKDKPFWIWDKAQHVTAFDATNGNCCFNHIVGLPESEKTGIKNPMFDYEQIIFENIFKFQTLPNGKEDPKNRHVWVKKATGLGITEFILRLMLWLCTRNDDFKNCQMCVVVGPKEEIAIGLVKRMKRILEQVNIYVENRATTLILNDVEIQAFPSNHLASYRGLTAPRFIFLDEGDFFKKNDIQDVRDTTERYITKSKPYIVIVSTPNKPDLLFQMIEKEPENVCIYNRLFFNYEWGIDKMFTREEIEIQKASPSFDREYDLKYAGKIGNVFSELQIKEAIRLGELYKDLPLNQYTHHFGACDPGWAKTTPVYIGELLKPQQVFRINYYEGFEKSTPEVVATHIFNVSRRYINLKWFIDGSDRGFVNTLKRIFDEPDWDGGNTDDIDLNNVKIIPVNFTKEHKQLLEHAFLLLASGKVAIPAKYDRLLTALRTAQATEWNLDKEETVNDDDLDDFRLMLRKVYFGKKA